MKNDKDARAHHDSTQREGGLPFFARFLEGQNNEGPSYGTWKFPSDTDEHDQTMKYPSDSDEGEVD